MQRFTWQFRFSILFFGSKRNDKRRSMMIWMNSIHPVSIQGKRDLKDIFSFKKKTCKLLDGTSCAAHGIYSITNFPFSHVLRCFVILSVCSWLASKFEDHKPPSQEDFSFISDHSVSTGKLRRMEFRLCRLLDFNLSRLTPFHFLNTFLRASNACPCRTCEYENPILREMVNYLLCLARLPCELMDTRPSLVAAAALYLARATLNIRNPVNHSSSQRDYPHTYWSPTLEHYTNYTPTHLRRSVLLIYRYQLQAQQLEIAAYQKYKDTSKYRVALKTARRLEDLDLPGMTLTHEDWNLTDSPW